MNVNPLQLGIAFLYPLRTENFRGYSKATAVCNGLSSLDHVKYFFVIILFRQKLPFVTSTCFTTIFKTIQKDEKPK